jgi:hypothetical protein
MTVPPTDHLHGDDGGAGVQSGSGRCARLTSMDAIGSATVAPFAGGRAAHALHA